MPEPASRRAYLGELVRHLHLDPDTESEVADEIGDHIDASARDLAEAGFTPERAERETLRRLGDPAALGREIRRAHRTRRHLLAAAGGGVVSAAAGAVRAVLTSWGFLIVVSVATLPAILLWMFATNGAQGSSSGANAIWGPCVAAAAAFGGSRAATVTVAKRGHLELKPAALAVGGIGTIAILVASFLFLRTTMDWSTAAAEVGAAAAWLLGATPLGRRSIPVFSRRFLVAVGAPIAIAMFLVWGPLAGPAVPHGPHEDDPPAPSLARIGPVLPEGAQPTAYGDGWEGEDPGVMTVHLTGPGADDFVFDDETRPIPVAWQDARLELWPAFRVGDQPGWMIAGELDPAFTAPVRVVPLHEAGADRLVGTIRYDDLRGLDAGWVVATASIQGQRAVLWSESIDGAFRGTLLDWLSSFLPGSAKRID